MHMINREPVHTMTKIRQLLLIGFGMLVFLGGCSSATPPISPRESLLPKTSVPAKINIEPAPQKAGALYTPVLMYHNIAEWKKPNPYVVSPTVFDLQMHWLKENGYTAVSYEDFYKAFAGKKKIPEKPMVITFDDGDLNQYEHAFPILKKYGFTGIFFVSTNVIGGRNAVSWDMLKEMRDAGMEIGSHTMTHRDLIKLSAEEVARDFAGSKGILERNLGIPIEFLAYPGGSYNEAIVKATQKAGYASAVSVRRGVFHSKKDESFYSIKRVHVDNELASFIKKIRGEEQ